MKLKAGYIDIDFIATFVTLIVIGVIVAIGTNEAVKLAWPPIKAWIHAITA